jgi:tetratricopeptide (TPR) repeat protein
MLLTFAGEGQTMKDAVALFERGELDSAIAISKQYTDSEPGAYQIIGQALLKQNKYNEAIPYLEKGKNSSNAQPSVRAWCMNDLGIAYFKKGQYDKAKENLKACIELNATANSVKSAAGAAVLFGLSDHYSNWITKETRHIVFHFQRLPDNAELYMGATEAAYDSINRFFRAVLPIKIDYFVWDNVKQGEKLLRQPLAFTKTAFCVTHTSLDNTRGHELTHSISYYATTIKSTNNLIFEGVAGYFDFSGRDRLKEIRGLVLGHAMKISITGIWKSGEHMPEGILYPLGAVLTGALIQNFGRDKFIQLLSDQSYENAKRIYGPALDDLIRDLESKINPPG